MKNRLFVDALKSVGLVSSGDDPEATVTFWKSKELQDEPDPVVNMTTSAESAQGHERFNMELDLSVIEDSDVRKSIEDAVQELTEQNEQLQAQVDELTPDPDPVEKADDEVKALIQKEREEREKLEKQLATERSERIRKEHVEKAKPYERLLGKAEDVGPVFADLAEAAPESFAKLEGWLTAATQRNDLSALFSKMGTNEDEGASYEDKRDAWVTKNREDGESVEAARLRFLQSPEGRIAKQEARS